ncbi:hypothetical protein pipiens_018223, partial [Culex pipiens pipiens]
MIMIDWVSIVRHSRTRISNYVSPKRDRREPHGRFMAYSDPPHIPFQSKSKQQQALEQQEEEKPVPTILAETPSPSRYPGTR